MNSTRFRYWFLSVPLTIGVVGVLLEWGSYTNSDTTSFNVVVGFIGFFVLMGCVFGGEKLYQKYKDR